MAGYNKGSTVDSWIHEWHRGVAICYIRHTKILKGGKRSKEVQYLAIVDGTKYIEKSIGAVKKRINKKLGPAKASEP